MRNQQFSPRYFTAIQLLLTLLAILGVLASTAGLASPGRSSIFGSTPSGGLNLHAAFTASAARLPAQATQLTTPVQAFDVLNRRAGGALTVSWDDATGIPRFLAGSDASARIPYIPTAAERGNALATALGFLDENRALFRLDSAAGDFGPARIEPDNQLNYSNVRLPQVYNGIPVYGKQLLVHLDQAGQIVAVNGQYAPGLDIPSAPSITQEQAEQVALDDMMENQLEAGERATVKATVHKGKTELMVYVDGSGKATVTWNVKIGTTSPLGEWTIFVNARRPVVVHAVDSLHNAKRRRTYSARNGTDIPGRLLADEGERTSDAIAQAAHDNAGKVYDYFSNTFKRDGVDGRGSLMVSTVHYGTDPEDAENAAWISEAEQMIYGDGGDIFKPLAYGLDVVGHEFTHGITDFTAQLIYEGQSGALNESYSDVFGAMIDRANWDIGEAVIKSPPYPVPQLRSLEDPALDGNYDTRDPLGSIGQPAHMREYANLPVRRKSDYGGVHVNSGIPNRAAFLLGQAIGKEKLEQIYYRALTQYLAPDSDFQDAARLTIQAATDLYGTTEANAARTAFSQVGITVGGSSVPAPPPNTTPTPGPQTPPSPQTLPAGCRDLIINGNFEGRGGWEEKTSNGTQIIDPELPRTGSRSAWLGGTDDEALQYIFQDVAVPANAASAKLSYYRLIHEEFSGLGGLFAGDADFAIILAGTDGNKVADIENLVSSQGDDKWKQAQFDLSRYAGRTLRLVFTASNPRGNVSSLFVDDVSLAACTTGQPPQAPPTNSNGDVYVAGRVLNSDTDRAIAGAQVFILVEGLTASDAADDDEVTDDEVLTYGITDNRGYYQTQDPVPRDKTYSVIVIADGYRPVIADDAVEVPRNATNPVEANGTMRPAR